MIRVAILVIIAKLIACIDEEVHEKYLTLPREEFIEYFNNQNFSWRITEYNRTFHYGKAAKFDDIENTNSQRVCVQSKNLPKNFDAREKWPQCESIKDIHDQGNCQFDWAFGAVNTASDRTCIHKNIHERLSVQDAKCSTPNYTAVCDGGIPYNAFQSWYHVGLVTAKCKPYNIKTLKTGFCLYRCADRVTYYWDDMHVAAAIYPVDKHVDCIKAELVNRGPVNARFKLYDDFESYYGGVYEHKYGGEVGLHSVRVIGYGVEDDKEYWLAANSWGDKWGEKGFFKIRIKQPDIYFENDMYSGIPRN